MSSLSVIIASTSDWRFYYAHKDKDFEFMIQIEKVTLIACAIQIDFYQLKKVWAA